MVRGKQVAIAQSMQVETTLNHYSSNLGDKEVKWKLLNALQWVGHNV